MFNYEKMKLIYHTQNDLRQVSKFDESLLKVATNAPLLRLASPYIGLSYLTRLIELSLDWVLLSDIEAWLESGNSKHRAECWSFILQNLSKIRHIPQLHAKVAIGNNMLFLGSANFTNTGIKNRTELSILVNEHATVNEATIWFDNLWRTASPPIIQEGDALVSALNDAQWTHRKKRVSLSSNAKRIQSTLVSTERPVNGLDIAKVMAEAGVEEAKLASLVEAEYQKVIEQLIISRSTFSFKYLQDALLMRFSSVPNNQLYGLIKPNIVNHLPGGFDVDGFDQFFYFNNLFHPWNETGLAKIKYLDEILAFTINHFSCGDTSYLPLEDEWLRVGVPSHKILGIVDKLVYAGILIQLDQAGDIERYSIDCAFEWPLRWKKFINAHSIFIKKSELHKQNMHSFSLKKTNSQQSPNPKRNLTKENKPLFKKDVEYIKALIKTDIKDLALETHFSFEEILRQHDQLIAESLYLIDENGGISQQKIDSLIDVFKSNKIPQILINEFRNQATGAFIQSAKDKSFVSKDWAASVYFFLYKEALKKWESIIMNRFLRNE